MCIDWLISSLMIPFSNEMYMLPSVYQERLAHYEIKWRLFAMDWMFLCRLHPINVHMYLKLYVPP